MPYSDAFPQRHEPLHLLLVEDSQTDRAILTHRLSAIIPKDSVILEAETGAKAMFILSRAEQRFDCVLLDVNLPDIHGIEMIARLQRMRPEVSIVMMTMEDDINKAIQCLQAGAEDFLIKDQYSNSALYRAIRYAMERQRNRLENIRLAQELAQAQAFSAMQKEFIHLVSHEFRTPISIISGATQLLAKKNPEFYTGAGAPQFNKITDAVTRLLGLLANVMRLNRMEEGKFPFQPELFDLREAVAQACSAFPDAPIKHTRADESLHYFGDHTLIAYTLQNVIGNALKYSPRDAAVEITMNRLARGIAIFIRDRGAGDGPEVLAQVGERFYRADETSHIEGTGLGIYLARRFMEYHGGSLIFCSEQQVGTTVRLFFPINAAELQAAS